VKNFGFYSHNESLYVNESINSICSSNKLISSPQKIWTKPLCSSSIYERFVSSKW